MKKNKKKKMRKFFYLHSTSDITNETVSVSLVNPVKIYYYNNNNKKKKCNVFSSHRYNETFFDQSCNAFLQFRCSILRNF